jgi:hypothetical protein
MSCSTCESCATPLQSPPRAATLLVVPSRPQASLRYTLQDLAENILTPPATPGGERKQAIMPLADIADVSALAEQLDQEQVPLLERMISQMQGFAFRYDVDVSRQCHRHGRWRL